MKVIICHDRAMVPLAQGVLLAAGDSSGRRPELPAIVDLCYNAGDKKPDGAFVPNKY